jgi:hypothetical protein
MISALLTARGNDRSADFAAGQWHFFAVTLVGSGVQNLDFA